MWLSKEYKRWFIDIQKNIVYSGEGNIPKMVRRHSGRSKFLVRGKTIQCQYDLALHLTLAVLSHAAWRMARERDSQW
jgi:hypothetical protein